MASDNESSFYLLQDEEMNAMATAAPRRVPAKGRADIGGRLRVAQILRDVGVPTQSAPERVAGSTNEVWRAGDYVIRVGFVPGAHRLRREARLAEALPPELHYPPVVASGIEAFGEWIVVRHRAGVQLSEAWAGMDKTARRSVVHDLAKAIKALHGVKLDEHQADDLIFPEGDGPLALPHQLPASRILGLLEQARQLPYMDDGLINDAVERTNEVADAIWAHERHGLVHGDLHFENVLAKDGVLISVVDFEWSRQGPPEIDLDILARFVSNPKMHVGGDYRIDNDEFRDVLYWWSDVYPELFQAERLHDRLMLVGLAFEVPWLLKFPPNGPINTLSEYHPVNQLKDLLNKGPHAERLGWVERDKYAEFQ